MADFQVVSPPGAPRPPRGRPAGRAPFPRFMILLALAPLLAAGAMAYVWFVQRVEVEADELCVLVRRIGQSLPEQADEQVVLYSELLKQLGESPDSTRFKGIVYSPLPPGGRYFYDPFFWERRTLPVTVIGQDEVGILVRKYGKPLAANKTVATEPDERGPLAEVLKPGRYNINAYAHDVKKVKPVFIPAGHVGVQTLYAGAEPENPNVFVVKSGERGVQAEVLPPGMYYNNPYVRQIDIIDVRSHTLDLLGDESIQFPSNDSFNILIEGTVEYAIRQDRAAYVMVAIGDHAEITTRIILPHMSSLARIEGSKLLARDFISGEKRSAFQNNVFEQLRDLCYRQGIEIRAALIRRIVPPPVIAQPISDRQVAEQQVKQFESEIKLADAEAKFAEQDEMQKQNKAIGEMNREIVSTIKEAEQRKSVALTDANKRLAVAALKLEAARQDAAALVARGQADAEVLRLNYEATARPLRDAVAAFGDGETYAQFFFYQKLGPGVKSVLDSTQGPLADIFRSLSKPHLTPQPAARPASPSDAPAAASVEGGQP